MQKGDHLFLVDGSAYIFRAYHALPPLTRKSDGMPVGAVSGFCNMLWKLVEESRDTSVGVAPTHFAVIFDHSSTTFRNALYDGYKANRPAPPEDLRPQFGLIREAVRAFDLPCVERQGFEADDLIATYARLAREAGGDVTIVSSDKDLMQLVGPGVILYDQMKDKRLGPEEVREKFGVYPEKMIDLQALVGDSSDNVPGIPGIGPKTAADLLETFGTLEALLERADEIKQAKRRESILANAEQARLSKRLVTLDQNTPLDVALDDLFIHEPDGEKLVAFLKAMEFTTLTRRVAAKLGTDAADVAPAKVDAKAPARGPDLDPDAPAGDAQLAMSPKALAAERLAAAASQPIDRSAYVTIRDAATLERWIARAYETGILAFDTETTSLDAMKADLVGLSFAVAPGEAAYVPIAHVGEGAGDLLSGDEAKEGVGAQIPLGQVLDLLKPVLTDPAILKVGQNVKYDYLVMLRHGIALAPFDDTMLISYVLDASSSLEGHGMDELSERLLGHKPISYRELVGTGKAAQGHRRLSDRQGDGIRRRGRRRDAAPLAGAQAAPRRRGHGLGLRAAGAAPRTRPRPHGGARHPRRPADPVTSLGSVRPEGGRPRGRHSTSSPASRSTSAPRSSSAKSSSASSGFPRQEDQDRAMGDRRQASRRPRRPGS